MTTPLLTTILFVFMSLSATAEYRLTHEKAFCDAHPYNTLCLLPGAHSEHYCESHPDVDSCETLTPGRDLGARRVPSAKGIRSMD